MGNMIPLIESMIIEWVGPKYHTQGVPWFDLVEFFDEKGPHLLEWYRSEIHPDSYDAIKRNLKVNKEI